MSQPSRQQRRAAARSATGPMPMRRPTASSALPEYITDQELLVMQSIQSERGIAKQQMEDAQKTLDEAKARRITAETAWDGFIAALSRNYQLRPNIDDVNTNGKIIRGESDAIPLQPHPFPPQPVPQESEDGAENEVGVLGR